MEWRHVAGIAFFVAMGILIVWMILQGRRRLREHREFLKSSGLTPSPQEKPHMEKVVTDRLSYWPGIDIALLIKERGCRVSECLQASPGGRTVFYLETLLKQVQGMIPGKRIADHFSNFFVVTCSPGSTGAFVILIEPDLPVPGFMKAMGRAADSLVMKATQENLMMDYERPLELQRQTGPGGGPIVEFYDFFAEPGGPFVHRFRPGFVDLLSKAREHGIYRVYYRDGTVLLETLYGTPYNFQGGKQVVSPQKVWEYVVRFAKEGQGNA